jgi:kynurenine 3-monooxygenase
MLANRGYTVELYEKRADLRKADISAGRSINLALSNRGISALKTAGVFDEVAPKLIPMKGRIVHLLDGNTDFQPYSINSHERNIPYGNYPGLYPRGNASSGGLQKEDNCGICITA